MKFREKGLLLKRPFVNCFQEELGEPEPIGQRENGAERHGEQFQVLDIRRLRGIVGGWASCVEGVKCVSDRGRYSWINFVNIASKEEYSGSPESLRFGDG